MKKLLITLLFTATVTFGQNNIPLIQSSAGGGTVTGVTGGNPVVVTGLSSTSGVNTTQIPNMSAPTVTCNGACSGGTWSYCITALDSNGEMGGASVGNAAFQTKCSANGSATNATTLTSTNKNVLTWSAVTGATGYTVYRTVSAGTPANKSIICDNTSALTCTDDGSINTASVTAPTSNSTGAVVAPQCNFTLDLTSGGLFQAPTGFNGGHIGSGICFDTIGALWAFSPTHYPWFYGGSSWNYKWSNQVSWSPNGTAPNAGVGISIAGSISQGHDSAPFELIATNNNQTNPSQTNSGYIATLGYNVYLTATSALTAGQVVKLDSANASSVVVTVTTDTGAGIPIGIVNNSPGAAGQADVTLLGTVTTAVLGTGTCSIGNFVIVDTTTNGRVKCTGTYAAGTIIGNALTAQASVGSTVTVLVNTR